MVADVIENKPGGSSIVVSYSHRTNQILSRETYAAQLDIASRSLIP